MTTVKTGSANASDLSVDGTINTNTGLTVSGAGASGAYLRGNGTRFVVASGIAAGDLTGTISTDRYSAIADLTAESKIGAAAGQVAAGDHKHSGADITSGTVATARLSTGTGSTNVALGDHTHTGTYAPASGSANYIQNQTASPQSSAGFKIDGAGTVSTITAGTAGSSITQEAWTAPTLLNSWVNFNTSVYQAAGYYKDSNGIVHLRGLIKDGSAANAVMFTLPTGYRPPKISIHPAIANNTICRIDIDASGNVNANAGGSTTFTSLDGISFDTRA